MSDRPPPKSIRLSSIVPVGMKPDQVAHLAGVFDATGRITAHVIDGGGTRIGYRIEPLLRLQRPPWDAPLFGKLDAYCEDEAIRHSMFERQSGDRERLIFEVKHPESIRRFLTPMMDYFVSKHREATIMLEDVLPVIEADEHLEKQGFYDLMGHVDTLRSTARYGGDPKYNQSYFAEEWGECISV